MTAVLARHVCVLVCVAVLDYCEYLKSLLAEGPL